LPQYVLPVATPHGSINVGLSLTGSTVCKVSPDWHQCQQVAATAAAAAMQAKDATCSEPTKDHLCDLNAAAVADAAVSSFLNQWADGTLQLDAHIVS
jgi:hypothetical protein